MILKFITHDTEFNTLEAIWLEPVVENGIEICRKTVKCRNYAPAEKEVFLEDVGEEGQKYVVMAGW